MALTSRTIIMISRKLSTSARNLLSAFGARPALPPAGGVRRLAAQAGGCGTVPPCCRPPAPDVRLCPPPPGPLRPRCDAPPLSCPPTDRPCGSHCVKASTSTPSAAAPNSVVRRSLSCSQVGGPLRRPLGPLPASRASVTLVQTRRSSDSAHDAGCQCPPPCGPRGCPKGCGCLPPPCDLPPKCIQYMSGYYYYPYGTWFAGPYHVRGICQPVGEDTAGCDEGCKGPPPSPPCPPKKDCKESSNSILDYCKKIKKQCASAKSDCSKPSNPCGSPKTPACSSPPSSRPKPPASKPPCQSRQLTCSSKPTCPPPKPTCPPSKAKSLTEICKSVKKPFPPSPPPAAKASPSVCGTGKKTPPCSSKVKSTETKGKFCAISSSTEKVAAAKSVQKPNSIFDFYLKSPPKPSTKLNRA